MGGVADETGTLIGVIALADPVVLQQLRDHVKGRLAAYKAPRHVVIVDEVKRGPNGKADYRWATDIATSAVAESPSEEA